MPDSVLPMLREFKPSLFFLLRFLAVYFAGNMIYGLFITSFENDADPITYLVTHQTSWLINLLGHSTSAQPNTYLPTVLLREQGETVLSVYEGCNGINVMVVFVAFLVAYSGPLQRMAWFLPLGLLIIHFSNLLRIGLLYFVSKFYESYFFYVHKYFFTAIIYVVVVALWIIWVRGLKKTKAPGVQPG